MKTRSLLAIPLLVLLLAAAACGGGSDDNDGVASLGGGSGTGTGTGSTSTGEQDAQGSMVEFAECMRDHGVDMPDPDAEGRFRVGPGTNQSPQEFEEAQKACRDLLPQGEGPRLSEEDQQVMQEAALAFAKCMRAEGVDMPDPQFGEGGGLMMELPRGVGPDDPTFKAAQKKCQPIMQEAERQAGLEGGPGPSTDSEGPGS